MVTEPELPQNRNYRQFRWMIKSKYDGNSVLEVGPWILFLECYSYRPEMDRNNDGFLPTRLRTYLTTLECNLNKDSVFCSFRFVFQWIMQSGSASESSSIALASFNHSLFLELFDRTGVCSAVHSCRVSKQIKENCSFTNIQYLWDSSNRVKLI